MKNNKIFETNLGLVCWLALALSVAHGASPVPPEAITETLPLPTRWESRLGDRERLLQRVERWRYPSREAVTTAVANGLSLEDPKARRKFSMELLEAAAAFYQLNLLSGETDGNAHLAKTLLDALLAALPEGINVTDQAGRDPNNLLLRNATWAYALRHRITGSREDLEQARRLLLEFAEKMESWPVLLNRRGEKWVAQETPKLYQNEESGGFWGRWLPLDLMECYPLLHAYTAIAAKLSQSEREQITSGIFDVQIGLVNRWKPGYHNTLVYRIDGLIFFGLALERPEYIHTGVQLLRELRFIGFSPDGFWHEATPAYHQQVVGRLASLAQKLEGYTDPPGWSDPATGKRFDHLALTHELALHKERIDAAWRKLTLPNGVLAAVNDADPDRYLGTGKTVSQAELLGTSGFAILGSGEGEHQQQLFLNYKGTYGHEHLDVNSFHWFALGRRWFDETRYRPLAGSHSTRNWSASTAAHNTVVIDEKNQENRFNGQQPVHPEDAREGLAGWNPRGSHNGSNHFGDLLLFDGAEEGVQVAEVEGRKSYSPTPERYRRTLVKVALEEGDGYLVDIFRVKGGEIHDYLLHGPLAEPYEASTAAVLEPANGRLHQFIDLKKKAHAVLPWEWTFSCRDGASSRSILLAPSGTTFFLGEAPAINRIGTAPFINLRHQANESTFVVVHEIRRKAGRISAVRLLSPPESSHVAVEITLGDRIDTVLSTLSGEDEVTATTSTGVTIAMKGRLSYLRQENERKPVATLWEGTALSLDKKKLITSPRAAYRGKISQTLSREAGDPYDALITEEDLPLDGSLKGAAAHVDLGGELVWSYRIIRVERHAHQTRLLVEHEPGFSLRQGTIGIAFHPGWGITGEARLTIPITSHLAHGHQDP